MVDRAQNKVSGLAADPGNDEYPGKRLGLPQDGHGSVAGFGRRVVAVFIDWFLALLISSAAWGGSDPTVRQAATLGLFAIMHVGLVGTLGGSPGHLAMGMRAVRMDGSAAGPARALNRTVLLVLVVPALVWDRDQRGLHDRFSGTILRRV
ncbi:MAG: RDD family protein [Angustibacter sp.]